MTDAFAVLLSLRARGIRVWTDSGQLRFESPKGVMGTEDVQQLRRLKHDIMDLLANSSAHDDFPLTARLPWSPIPLTPIQRLLWLTQRNEPHPRAHAFAARITGNLHVPALREALVWLQRRHDILRTSFVLREGQLEPLLGREVVCDLQTVGMEGSAGPMSHAAIERSLGALTGKPVRFAAGPLFEATLIREETNQHILVVCLDQMLSDCKSNDILREELWRAYVQLVGGNQPLEGRPDVQHADYAVWLHQTHEAWLRVHAPYWIKRFCDVPRKAEPVGYWDVSPERTVSVSLALDVQLSARLAEAARRRQVFIALLVLTGFVAAVFACFRLQRITVVMVDHGRHRPELEKMVGWLVNNLFLRIDIGAQTTFNELIDAVRREVDMSDRHRDFNWIPAVIPGIEADVYFNWVTTHGEGTAGTACLASDGGTAIHPYRLEETAVPRFPGIVFRHDSRISGTLSCMHGSTWATRINSLSGSLQSALESLIEDPGKPIGILQAKAGS